MDIPSNVIGFLSTNLGKTTPLYVASTLHTFKNKRKSSFYFLS